MRKIMIALLVGVLAFGLVGCGGSSGAAFNMHSNDTVGASKHLIVGNDREPDGTYKLVCTEGHGAVTVNDENMIVLAADDYAGQEYSGLTYTTEAALDLKTSDEIMIRNYNSSEFKVDFYAE